MWYKSQSKVTSGSRKLESDTTMFSKESAARKATIKLCFTFEEAPINSNSQKNG